MIEGLSGGRIVHYVLANGACRAAIVVRVWSRDGCSNLAVFRDGSNDDAVLCSEHCQQVNHPSKGNVPTSEYVKHPQPEGAPLTFWATSVLHSDQHSYHTWHWPTSCHPERSESASAVEGSTRSVP